MKKIVFVVAVLIMGVKIRAQDMSVQQYIDTYKDIAIAEMKRSGIPASVTLAQGILETENGNSELVKKSNNHFGIKCKSNWTGDSVSHTDDAPNECFRKYKTAEDSYRDHSDFLRNNARYAPLFTLRPDDYKGWAYGLKRAGYATNPRYPLILINNIEQNNLQQYDSLQGTGTAVAVPRPVDTIAPKKVAVIPPTTDDERSLEKSTISHKGKSLFNKLRAVYAVKGTSLLAVATREDIPLSKLMEYNDISSDGLLKEGQWIYLERKAKAGNRDYYITTETETLYSISQNNAVQMQSLMDYNQLAENAVIPAGTKIRLRP